MAKDKTKKAEKAPKNSAFASPSDVPSSGGNKWPVKEANLGKLFIIQPTEHMQAPGYKGEMKLTAIANIVIINEKNVAKSEEVAGAEFQQGYIATTLRNHIDSGSEQLLVARLRKDIGNKKLKGEGEPWFLENASASDLELAQEYVDSAKPKLASSPAGKKSKAKDSAPAEDEKPAKKSKGGDVDEKPAKKDKGGKKKK